ncbi:hypothetical protein ACJMK2_023101 [Sinanodonta woodiana]|uniref:C2H2-type domain-containing protein n=1 Tax=Sinanodonta woodiana TaxID=1069815 RepID=A0ABD3T3Z9_SINWO
MMGRIKTTWISVKKNNKFKEIISMQEKPPDSKKMSVLVNQVDFKLLIATKKVLSVKLTRINADEKCTRSECSYVPKRTALNCVLCETCGYLFANEFIFRKHFVHQSFHHLQSFKCERCDRLFPTEHLLRRHQVNFKIQAGWRCKPYQCHVCRSRFSQMKFLKNHFSLNRKCELNCAFCGRDFLERKMLKRHIIENHIIPNIKTKDDYSVLQDFGILPGNTVVCTCPQNTSPHSVIKSSSKDISVIKIEPLVMDTKSTKYDACLINSTTMEPPKPFIQKPFNSLGLGNVLNLVENGGMYVPRDSYMTMHNTSQKITETISSVTVPIQYHHATLAQLMAENCSFQKQNTQDPFSSKPSRAMTNDSVDSQHQQAALLQFLPKQDSAKSYDTLTVDSQVTQYSSQQSVFPDSFTGHNQSLVQKNHRVLSDILKKPPSIITLSPAHNQSNQFLFQQVTTERGSSPQKRTPQSVSSTEGDQVIHGFVQISQDQTGHQMCEEKQCVLPPGLIDHRFHNVIENCSTVADGRIYSPNTSQKNGSKETEDQSEPDTSILVASLPSGSQVVIQNKVCNITPCRVCKKKFIYDPGSDQQIVNVFQCTKCKIIFSQEKEVLTHKCGKMDVPILSYSIKTKKTMQPNELAVVSGATRNSEELQKSFTSAIVAQHSEYEAAKNCHVYEDASAAESDQCCQSCRSIINVSQPQTQPMVYLIDDPSHLNMIQNLNGNAVSLLFESFDQYPCNRAIDMQSQLKTTIDSSHRNNTMQVPECLQQKTLDSSHERECLKYVVACLKQKVIEKIKSHISCLIDQSYKEKISNSIQSEWSFPAYSTNYSDQVRLQQEDMCVWNGAPMAATSDGNQTVSVGMTCNMTDTSGNQGEDSSQENKNAQIISTTQIKEEVIDPADEQRLRGGHVGISISDQVSEMGEGLVEEAGEKHTWKNPRELIKGEEITDSKKHIQIFDERSARIDYMDSAETLEKPKLINLLAGMEGIHEGAVWTDSTGHIKVFSQNCNEVEINSSTITVSNPNTQFMESPEMDICSVDDEFDIVGSTSVLPEGFVYVENM